MTSPRIGWIGTGVMGNAMAHRVLRAGYPLKVHTRTKSKAQSLIDSEQSGLTRLMQRTAPQSAAPLLFALRRATGPFGRTWNPAS